MATTPRNISPLVKDNIEDIDDYHRTHGLSALVIQFAGCSHNWFKLINLQLNEFYHGLRKMTLFLLGYEYGHQEKSIFQNSEFGLFISSLSNTAFWDSYHQRDLLLVISERWKKLGRNIA